MRYLDRNGREIKPGDRLVTWNDDPEFDLWSREENGETVVLDICRHGVNCTKWQPDDDPDSESIYDLRFVEVVT